MAHRAPGKHYRNGLSLIELTRMFPDDSTAERWFVAQRWQGIIACPFCGSVSVQERSTRKPQPYRCRDCRKDFSVRTGTPMHASNLGYQTWAIAFYLLATGIKGTSSMKLHRDLKITQKSAWHLAHRIRESLEQPASDIRRAGRSRRDVHRWQRAQQAREAEAARGARAGRQDRRRGHQGSGDKAGPCGRGLEYRRRHAQGIRSRECRAPDAMVYTDGETGYAGLPNHEAVKHTVGEYVRGMAHTNGIESFWSMLKRGYVGTYHKMSPQHLGRYVGEFAGRHNQRPDDTVDQMAAMVAGHGR